MDRKFIISGFIIAAVIAGVAFAGMPEKGCHPGVFRVHPLSSSTEMLSTSYGGDISEEFYALGKAYERSSGLDIEQASRDDGLLMQKENILTNKILASEKDLLKLCERASQIEVGLLERLIKRIQFQVTQENKEALTPTLRILKTTYNNGIKVVRGKKKIAQIGGQEVNLLDGEWNETPDGKRYWVSNEYPDIILTPAEYRRYMATAVTVEE